MKFSAKKVPGSVFLSVADKDRWETKKSPNCKTEIAFSERWSYHKRGDQNRPYNKTK